MTFQKLVQDDRGKLSLKKKGSLLFVIVMSMLHVHIVAPIVLDLCFCSETVDNLIHCRLSVFPYFHILNFNYQLLFLKFATCKPLLHSQ